MQRISFKTWYGDVLQINEIPRESLKENDILIDKDTKGIFIYTKKDGWVSTKFKNNNSFESSFFQKTFIITEQTMSELLELFQGMKPSIVLQTKNNETIELNSFEGKILFNELF